MTAMEIGDDDDDLKLARASAGLLADLEHDLPRLLWKHAPAPQEAYTRFHTRVRRRDLDRVLHLIEPFQGEPHLLDAKLNSILPPIVDAYLQYLSSSRIALQADYLDLETAICSLLYTLCKVRGYKVIVAFLSNEPRHLEPVLGALERTVSTTKDDRLRWQVPYVLLLWLSHLLLTPFDLISISAKQGPSFQFGGDEDLTDLPPLPSRIARIGLVYLTSPTKAQDSAAAMLVRLASRPDIQKFRLADHLLQTQLIQLRESNLRARSMYDLLGSLRFVAGVTSSAELNHLVPIIYQTCMRAFDEQDESSLSSNAVAKKLVVKIFRNIAILSLHSLAAEGVLPNFIQTTDVLESVIDYLLRSLGDKDTPVRYAAAKAISLIVMQLESAMGHDVVQAILDTFKEDLPRSASELDFNTVNALKWHGLTLALSHTLFKRSAAPAQLSDILDALMLALQFQQRTATGSTLGTNVRDAANFGLWSLSRRYTTSELLLVSTSSMSKSNRIITQKSVLHVLAIQLILSACLDPAGNIRRGSSATLQELIGRHPDQILSGISLVQIVDYQAVSLRTRAMFEVTNSAALLHPSYWQALLEGLFGWRGLGSADVPSREAAALSISQLAASRPEQAEHVLSEIISKLRNCSATEVESLHGLTLAAALILKPDTGKMPGLLRDGFASLLESVKLSLRALEDFSPRMLRSEVSVSLAKLLTGVCNFGSLHIHDDRHAAAALCATDFDGAVGRLLVRHEESILEAIPSMGKALLNLKRAQNLPLSCIEIGSLSEKVYVDGSKSSLHGAGRAITLGTLLPIHEPLGLDSQNALAPITTLCTLIDSMNVDWRVIGVKALQLIVNGTLSASTVNEGVAEAICMATHRGLNDYTIDERGDVGSLVRLQSIICASKILTNTAFLSHTAYAQVLQGDMLRLSLEKLDRVRLKAAQCRKEVMGLDTTVNDVASISSSEYFEAALSGLGVGSPPHWTLRALLEGCISCAGTGAEPVIQASRRILALRLQGIDGTCLEQLLTIYAEILKEMVVGNSNSQPALEVLAFLLDMQIPQRLSCSSGFKWRNLLSTVQKLHHKSNDIPKITAAVHVYMGLADVPTIRGETLKKLVSILRTNPYPRVRGSAADALWLCTGDDLLKQCDWTRPVAQNADVFREVQRRYAAVGGV